MKAPRSTTIDHVLKYTAVFGGVQGLSILMSVVRNKLATVLLGAAGMGLMGIYQSVSEFVSSTANLGLPFSSVRSISELFATGDEAGIRRFVTVVRTWCLWTAIVAGLICVACSPLLAQLFFTDDTSATWRPAMVAPLVMATMITAGEMSILKGMRRLKRVATISVLCAVSVLCITIPIFWAMHTEGILLALNITALVAMAIHLAFTLPIFRWHVELFSRSTLADGWPMIRVGIPYMLAAFAGSGVTMALTVIMLRSGTLEDIGFFRSAKLLMVSYAGIVFSALEADFFPRLSSVNHDRAQRNSCINQQIQVCVSLIGPFMIALAMCMPLVLAILFASEFSVIRPMAIAAVFYTFFRGITTPISYCALAHGDSLFYLVMEVIYDLASLGLIATGFSLWGLLGAGIGLSASALFDMVLITVCYSHIYGFRFEAHTLRIIATQTCFVTATVAVCFMLTSTWQYVTGFTILAVSALAALHSLSKRRIPTDPSTTSAH